MNNILEQLIGIFGLGREMYCRDVDEKLGGLGILILMKNVIVRPLKLLSNSTV